MLTFTYGTLPTVKQITKRFPKKGYNIECNKIEFTPLSAALNQGIDAHLEAIFFDHSAGPHGKQVILIKDAKSLQVLIRRLIEAGEKNADDDLDLELELDLASSILQTLGIEWI